jgi:hypothetical protein
MFVGAAATVPHIVRVNVRQNTRKVKLFKYLDKIIDFSASIYLLKNEQGS